jgi:hypothetical protein
MLFDLTFPCYLKTFSGKKCLMLTGKVICAFFCPAYRSSPVIYRIIIPPGVLIICLKKVVKAG